MCFATRMQSLSVVVELLKWEHDIFIDLEEGILNDDCKSYTVKKRQRNLVGILFNSSVDWLHVEKDLQVLCFPQVILFWKKTILLAPNSF